MVNPPDVQFLLIQSIAASSALLVLKRYVYEEEEILEILTKYYGYRYGIPVVLLVDNAIKLYALLWISATVLAALWLFVPCFQLRDYILTCTWIFSTIPSILAIRGIVGFLNQSKDVQKLKRLLGLMPPKLLKRIAS